MSTISNSVLNSSSAYYPKAAQAASTKNSEVDESQVLSKGPKGLNMTQMRHSSSDETPVILGAIHATYDSRKVYDILDLKNTEGLEELLKKIQEMNQLYEDVPATEVPKAKPSLWKQGTESDKSYYTRLASYLGLNATDTSETDAASSEINTKADFLDTLRKAIKSDGKKLQTRVDAVLKKHKIQLGKQDRVTFQLDSEGELLISGVRDKKMLAKIRSAIGSDPKLAEELKTLAAKQKVHDAVKADRLESVMEGSTATRTQLTKNYLKDQGNFDLESIELDKTDAKNRTLIIEDEKLRAVVDSMEGLADELVALLDTENHEPEVGRETVELVEKTSKKKAEDEVDFAYKNGVIMNDTIFDKSIVDSLLRRLAMEVIPPQTDENGKLLPESQQLKNYTVVMQADGRFRIENVNEGVDAKEKDAAYLMTKAGEHFREADRQDTALEAVDDILMKHQYDYGDVTATHVNDEDAHLHEVRFSVANGPQENLYEIVSDGAESVAGKKLQNAVVDFSVSFTQYVGKQFKLANPDMDATDINRILTENLPIGLNREAKIEFGKSDMENEEYAEVVDKAVKLLNERMDSDDPLADENFEHKGDDDFNTILKIMMDIKHNLEHLAVSN